jgi:hypothetical protein
MAARTEVPVTFVSRFGVVSSSTPAPKAADLVNGNVSLNDGYTWLEMTNSAGASRTVTLFVPQGFDADLLISNRTYTMPANGVYYTGVFPMSFYGNYLLYTASGSGITFRAISMRGDV